MCERQNHVDKWKIKASISPGLPLMRPQAGLLFTMTGACRAARKLLWVLLANNAGLGELQRLP